LEYNPINKYAYVADLYSHDVSVINSATNKVVKTIDVGDWPYDLEYSPGNNRMYVANSGSDTVSVISSSTIIIGPAADAGPNLTVDSGSLVRLDGSSSNSSSNSSEDSLPYKWTQTGGPRVTLNDQASPNPTFTAPRTAEQSEITFSLLVTDEEGNTSEPDEVKITVNPLRLNTSENDESRTLGDEITGILRNPLNVTNSIDSADRLRDILSDNN
jgi:YVTN family beta-propeller protein